MVVTLPEGDLETRLSRYLDGFNNRHGPEDSSVEGNVVLVVAKPVDVPAVLATAR
jgi:NADH-quinone oxidoreductase subunit C